MGVSGAANVSGALMRRRGTATVLSLAGGALAIASGSAAIAAGPTVPAGFSITTLATGGSLSKPDDITVLGNDLFVSFQNGVGAKGEPAPGGGMTSTVQEYTMAGAPVAKWTLTGKCDGLSADPANNRLIATVNEDANSSLYTITPSSPTPTHYVYSPSSLPHQGGTDAISVVNGQILIAASAPKAASGPAAYRVQLAGGRASLTPVFTDTSVATTANSGANHGKSEKLALTDPDSTEVVPSTSPRFAGNYLLDSQGDKELVFTGGAGGSNPALSVLHTSTEVNDTAFVTGGQGTLYVTDNATNSLIAITGNFAAGTAYSAVPKDSSVNPGTVGTLDLSTGTVTRFATGLGSPAGLLFVPAAASIGGGAPAGAAPVSGGQVGVIPAGGVAAGGGSTSRTPFGLLVTGGALLLGAGALAGGRRLRRR